MADTWTVLKLIQWTSDYFAKRNIDAPRLTAELLLSHVLKLSRVKLYMAFDQPVQKDELAQYRALIERRVAGEPTAYLLGQREFYGRTFKVDARVLVPRPETERLVDQVLQAIPSDTPARVLDLCTGSCCIAATLAAERPQVRAVATDLSQDALDVARENLTALGLLERVELRQGDLWAAVKPDEVFEVVVSNPPYVADAAFSALPPEVRREPKVALLAGATGMSLIERIAEEAPRHLVPGGLLAMEIGDDQQSLARDLLNRMHYRDAKVLPDWAGKDRIAVARRPAS